MELVIRICIYSEMVQNAVEGCCLGERMILRLRRVGALTLSIGGTSGALTSALQEHPTTTEIQKQTITISDKSGACVFNDVTTTTKILYLDTLHSRVLCASHQRRLGPHQRSLYNSTPQPQIDNTKQTITITIQTQTQTQAERVHPTTSPHPQQVLPTLP